jgi:phosphate transport system substrate-binding protein
MRKLLISLVVVGALAVVSYAPPASAQTLPAINGAGSTWSQNALDQWRADVTRSGLRVNYQGVGSTSGRTLFAQGQLDYAVSEIPYLGTESKPSFKFVYLPIVAGGTSVMYRVKAGNGQQITNLRLSSNLVAQIFTRKIRKWNDAAIARENPGVSLPNKDITVVVRSDGSGTSYQFSDYLKNREPALWAEFAAANRIPNQPTSNWPTLTGASAQPFSDGVANYVARGDGAITYVEASYAIERRVPVAAIRNQSGNYVLPTAQNVAVALTRASLNPDRTQVLSGVYTNPAANSYPISSYSYMLAKTSGISEDKGRAIARFVYYFACAGQKKAAPLGYSPMPSNLVKAAFEAIVQVPGAEKPPVISPSTCANPSVTGSFTVSGGGSTPTTTAPQGGGGGTGGGGTSAGGGNTSGGGSTGGGSTGGGTTGGGTTGGGTTDAATEGVPLDTDGDGQADGVDTDGDGVVDATVDGVELASGTAAAGAAGSVQIKGDGPSTAPLVMGTIFLIALIVIPPILLSSGSPDNRFWKKMFRS